MMSDGLKLKCLHAMPETLRVRAFSNNDYAIYDAVMAAFKLKRAVGDL